MQGGLAHRPPFIHLQPVGHEVGTRSRRGGGKGIPGDAGGQVAVATGHPWLLRTGTASIAPRAGGCSGGPPGPAQVTEWRTAAGTSISKALPVK